MVLVCVRCESLGTTLNPSDYFVPTLQNRDNRNAPVGSMHQRQCKQRSQNRAKSKVKSSNYCYLIADIRCWKPEKSCLGEVIKHTGVQDKNYSEPTSSLNFTVMKQVYLPLCSFYIYLDLLPMPTMTFWKKKNPFSEFWILSCAKNRSLDIWETVVFSQLWSCFPTDATALIALEKPQRRVLSPHEVVMALLLGWQAESCFPTPRGLHASEDLAKGFIPRLGFEDPGF